jgi:AcrR family transcriptional regulator
MPWAVARARREEISETSSELLDAAERLFAEQGVENVALTQIVASTGQRNRSALHYHFGSRGGVLAAVMDRRLAAINARRHALLEALPIDAPAQHIVRADVAALVLIAVEEPWGGDYVSILAQVRFHPQLLGEHVVRDEYLSGLRLARRRLRALAPQIPVTLLARRMNWLSDSAVFALARWMRDRPPSKRSVAAAQALIDDLVAYGTAGLLAAPLPREKLT